MCQGVAQFVDESITPSAILFQQPLCQERTLQRRGTIKLNLQMAKAFKDVAFRFGLFESTAGLGIDYDIPFRRDDFRWVTTLEAFDFYGDDRLNDERPHFKWLNSLYFFNNFYVTFGADDFISRHNANAFFGFGMRLADDDMKHLMGRLGSMVASGPTLNG
jgi:phospholipid/cholesterol/gamma-HCH transport system substrate-binding protein